MNQMTTISRSEELYKRILDKGAKAIDEFILTRQTEELFLDFKRSSDSGSGVRLSQNDRNNLSKAISGFGNSEGGVLIWGVDCSTDASGADIARAKNPIEDVYRFVSWLEGAVSGCTVPPHSKVVHTPLPVESGPAGYVATHIPKSFAAPHQVVGRLQYFIRAGSDFVPTPHMVLAGMFGRANPPVVFQNYIIEQARVDGSRVSFGLGLMLCNQGPGIASDLYMTIKSWEFADSPCALEFEPLDRENWSGCLSLGRFFSTISNPGFRVPPESQSLPLSLKFNFLEPIDEGIKISGIVGSGSSPPHRFQMRADQSRVLDLYREIISRRDSGQSLELQLRSFPSLVLSLD